MSCSRPIFALDLGVLNPDTGLKKIKILSQSRVDLSIRSLEYRYGKEHILALPCGHCAGCLLDYRKEWATRCYLESLYHSDNSFITLTYDEAHVPSSLVKKHLQKFIKTLRNKGFFCRFFGCGELGSQQKRPHYHVLLFGYRPSDLKYYSKSDSGEYLYTSDFLNNLWNKGFVIVGDVSHKSCSYVAGYVSKKLGQEGFLLMSNRPGIGYQYFVDHIEEIYVSDSIVLNNGLVVPVPKYCDKVAESLGYDLSLIKNRRIEKQSLLNGHEINIHSFDSEEELLKYKDSIMKNRLKLKRRNL